MIRNLFAGLCLICVVAIILHCLTTTVIVVIPGQNIGGGAEVEVVVKRIVTASYQEAHRVLVEEAEKWIWDIESLKTYPGVKEIAWSEPVKGNGMYGMYKWYDWVKGRGFIYQGTLYRPD